MEWEIAYGTSSAALWAVIFGVSLAALIALAILIFSDKIGEYSFNRLLKKIIRQSNQGVQS